MSRFIPDDYGYTMRQRREDEAPDEYRALFDIEDERRRVEWEEEFQGAFPYVTNGREIERAIAARK